MNNLKDKNNLSNMKDHYDVYIASPFFNPEQLERVEFIKSVLDKKGLTYYSPKDESVVSSDAGQDWRQAVLDGNIEAIKRSDMIIAVTNGKDMGTMVEFGMGIVLGKTLFPFAEGLKGQFNLMLAVPAHCVFTSREQLENYDFDKREKIEYRGEIE